MRTVERFAFIFGIVNLIVGVLSLFSFFVSPTEGRGIFSRFMPRRGKRMLDRAANRSVINRRSGMLLGRYFGGLGATNPQDAILHSALGAVGLATRPINRFSRAYMWVLGGLYASMAVMGWAKTGFKPGIHDLMGFAIDWRDNLIHTVWGTAALLLAARPDLGRRPVNEVMEMANAGIGATD